MINGNKTYVGILLMGIGGALTLFGYVEIGEPLRQVGETLAGIGFAHKLAKAAAPVEVVVTTQESKPTVEN